MQKISWHSLPVPGCPKLCHVLIKRYLSLVLLLFSFFCTYSNPLNGQVTLRVVNERAEKVLKEIELQSGYNFFYKTDEIDLDKKVSLNVIKMPIHKILEMIFDDGTVSFTTIKNQIVLKKVTVNTVKKNDASPPVDKRSQPIVQVSVTGVVTDEFGAPVPNVSIMENGTNNGATTDENGRYTITVSRPDAVLSFSNVGYARQEIAVGDSRNINVTLIDDVQALSEVIVMGYASQRKSDLTGSVSTVKGEDINTLPAASVAESLQGRVAGVQVVTGSGEPGAASDIVIRGGGSVNGMPPLFIVDGVRMGTNYNFNNQDIESIEVLKDASAAAIYGAQAAGGVVLIQTKRGAAAQEKLNVDFNAMYGVRSPMGLINLMNTRQLFDAREAFGYDVSGWGDPSELPDVDWVDVLFGKGSDQNYALSLTGSSDLANYYVSGNYFRQDGVRPGNSFERYSLRLNSDYKIGSRFRAGETVYIYKSYRDPHEAGGTYFRTVPTMPVTNEDGSWGNAPTGGYFNGRNPYQRAMTRPGGTAEQAVEGNIYLDYKLMDGLNFRTTLGASIGGEQYSLFAEEFNNGAQAGPAELWKEFAQWERYTVNFVMNYDKSFGNHDIKALAGYEMYREDRHTLEGYAADFAVERTQSFYLNTNLPTQRVYGGIYPDTRLVSQFGRFNYSYNNKYLLSATVRRDGSDRFGPENKWGVFPAFSAGWRISQEPFFENVNGISSLQLRASYGVLGNIGAIPQYLYQPQFGPQNLTALPGDIQVRAYGRNLSMPNPSIRWEEVRTTNIGLDASFLSNSLTVAADWYQRITHDMIYAVPVPLSAGYHGNPVFTNIGSLSNEGIELAVNYNAKVSDLTMDFGVNGSYNKNRVISLDGGASQINDGAGGQYLSNPISRTIAGQPLSQFFGYVVEGIYATDQEVADRGVIQPGAGAGDLIYRDVDGNGVITDADRDFIGNPWPKFNLGVNINLKYKRFDLSMAFAGVFDVDVYNAVKHYTDFLAGDYNASPNIFQASFFAGNGLTDRPRLGYTDENGLYQRDPNANYTRISSYFVEDGSFLRLRNARLGYTLPEGILKSLKIRSANVYVTTQNLLTFTGYTGSDPEVLGENNVTARGIDFNSRNPQTRLVSIGMQMDF